MYHSSTWRQSLLAKHWLLSRLPNRRASSAIRRYMLGATPFVLAETGSRALFSQLNNGFQQITAACNASRCGKSAKFACCAYFHPTNPVWDSNLPYDVMWIETSGTLQMRWGALAFRDHSDHQNQRIDEYIIFADSPGIATPLVFYGAWSPLRDSVAWHDGVLTEPEFATACMRGDSVLNAVAIDANDESCIDAIWSKRKAMHEQLNLQRRGLPGPGEIYQQSLGAQFAVILLSIYALANARRSAEASKPAGFGTSKNLPAVGLPIPSRVRPIRVGLLLDHEGISTAADNLATGQRAAACLHTVRGHWRSLQKTGRKVWVRATERGDPARGDKRRHGYLVLS